MTSLGQVWRTTSPIGREGRTKLLQVGNAWLGLVGPIAGAAIALTGVLIGLAITGRRAKRESHIAREDQYRSDARKAIAELLNAAEIFQRQGAVLSDQSKWISSGFARATVIAEETEVAMARMQQLLGSARLIVDDPTLASDLDLLRQAGDSAAQVIHDAVDSFWEGTPLGAVQSDRSARWRAFADATKKLQSDAFRILRPTIREPPGRRRSGS
jgi:hypothetical protein